MKFIKPVVGIFLLIVVSVTYYFFPRKISDNKVKIKCNYMAYACGDCYPQYKVNEILEGGNDKTNRIINTDLAVEFYDKKIEEEFDKNTAKCLICYDITLTGYLKYSKSKGMYIVAQTVDYQLKNDSCCN